MPDMSSTPAKPTVSPWLYQPRESGGRDGVPATERGAVASYSSPKPPKPTFPALSLQVPFTEPVRLSGAVYVLGAEHVSSPETASSPEKATERGWLYQPF